MLMDTAQRRKPAGGGTPPADAGQRPAALDPCPIEAARFAPVSGRRSGCNSQAR